MKFSANLKSGGHVPAGGLRVAVSPKCPKLHISSCSVVIWTCIVVPTPLVVFRGFWGCLGVQTSVLEHEITFFHLGRPLFGQGPRYGWYVWHTPEYPKIAHIVVYSNWMVVDRGCNTYGGIWGHLGVFESTNEEFWVQNHFFTSRQSTWKWPNPPKK